MSGPLRVVLPASLVRPQGYSHGVRGAGELLFVAGQIGCDGSGALVPGGLPEQFAQALDNVLAVVAEAGGRPESIARLTLFVTSKARYRECRRLIGELYRARMGRHYPAMTLVEVKSLLDDAAEVEIEATALL